MTQGNYVLIYNKVRQALENERMFLNPELSLKSLSKAVGTNTVYLSKAINQGYGCSFSVMLANYRMDYIIAKAIETGENIETLNEKLGFWSRSTFYDVFKSKKGASPKRFIESIREKGIASISRTTLA